MLNCSAENLTLAKKKELKGIANRILSEANQEIRETFPGLDISDAANLVPEFHLEKKKNKIEKQKMKRKIYREIKENIESQRMETAVERYNNSQLKIIVMYHVWVGLRKHYISIP